MPADLLQCFYCGFVKHILLAAGKATPIRLQLVTAQERQTGWQQNNILLGEHLYFKNGVGREERALCKVEAVTPNLHLTQGQDKELKLP